MLYYLYVKTHKKTGLKYLGHTRQNPFTYHGSGKKWVSHLEEHGYEYDTEILLESQDITEIASLGRKLSAAWDIVDSDLWANKIPETCGGYGNFGNISDEARMRLSERMRGDKNIAKHPTFREKHSGEKHWTKRPEHQGKEHVMKRPEVREKISGKNCYRYDHTIYTFEHNVTGETVQATKQEFQRMYDLDQSCISRLVSGKFKQYKGWTLVSLGV